ncbi:MAG: enoyl-CoA hydratase/isomerase family protein, partial [Gemmatimonadales bacterium]
MLHSEINDGVATVTIDNPPHNILTCTVLESLRASLAALAREPALRVLVLRAGGDNFSAGADVEEHLPPTYEHMIPEFIATVVAVREFPVPVIAAVQGKCLGGGFEIVQPCDLIIATDDAVFGQPEIRLGVMAPAACVLLPRAIGWTRAAELLFTGDTIGAVDAYRVGLLNAVVSADELG